MEWLLFLAVAAALVWWLVSRRPSAAANGDGRLDAILFDPGMEVEVVGESNYQEALERVCGGRTEEGANHECMAALVPEPTNGFDPLAIQVRIDGRLVGYLPRPAAKAYKPVADALAAQGKIGRHVRGSSADGIAATGTGATSA